MRTLLVVGRSSNGKSSVGNSILGGQIFSPRTTAQGVRLTNEKRSNNEYIVVDCSGIGDTEGDKAGDVKCVIQSALEGLMLCDNEKEIALYKKIKSSGAPALCNDNNENQETIVQNRKIDQSVPTTARVDNETQSSQVLTDDTQRGPDSVDDTHRGPDSVDDTQRGPDSVDDTQRGPDSADDTQHGPDSVDDTQCAPDSADDTQRGPDSANDTQHGPDSANDTQRGPDSANDTQRGPDSANDTQRGPDSANDTQRGSDSANDSNSGFDAMIFVMKYGVRFTKQEKDAVQMVKSIFGEDVFRDWGILVFSYGDNFELDTEDDEKTFEDWCREQTGDIKTLFEEVDYRCVLFDNKSRDEKKHNSQREHLKNNIEKIVNRQKGKYTRAEFVSADAGKVKLLLQVEFKEIQSGVKRLIQESDEAARKMEEIHPEWLSQLETLKQIRGKLMSEKKKLEAKDQGTGLFRDIVIEVECHLLKIKSTLEKFSVSSGESISNSEVSIAKPGGHIANTELSIVSPGGSRAIKREADVRSQGDIVDEAESKRNADSESVRSGSSECLHWLMTQLCCCCPTQDSYKQLDETSSQSIQ